MRVEPLKWPLKEAGAVREPHLILVFGPRDELETSRWFEQTRRLYPNAHIVASSTAGEILGAEVGDLGVIGVAVQFAHTKVRVARVNVKEYMDSETAAAYLARGIPRAGLAHVLLICDGQHVNGSAMVRGLSRFLPPGVAITGGLAGDGTRFERTYVCADGPPVQGNVAAVAFYGDRLRVGHGSMGGWVAEGDPLLVTRARGNVVEQLDGTPALARYQKLLGADAEGLPASGLRHPLHVRTPDGHGFVRTLLNVDERAQTLTFAGDVPVGAHAQLMRADFERLVQGAGGAARASMDSLGNAELAILISCVGRRLVLGEETRAEIAAVRKVLGEEAPVVGFYSYGEICPSAPDASCELHNQTMTITTLRET